jgi:hypothetical protein
MLTKKRVEKAQIIKIKDEKVDITLMSQDYKGIL